MALTSKSGPPPALHHRKRTGGHHRKQTKHYTKTYWPYLPMLGIAGFGLLLNLVWTAPSSQVLSFATNTSIAGLLEETNGQRQSANEPLLRANAQLTAAAQAKANDMAARNYWSHVTPDGRQPWWFVTNAGYEYQSTGENLAYGFATSQATVTGWMNSAGHRANILNAEYQDVGFGIANADSYQNDGQQTIVVALYGRPRQTTVAAAPAPATAAKSTVGHSSTTQTPASAAPQPSATPVAQASVPPTPAPVTKNVPVASTSTRDSTAVLGTEESVGATSAAPTRSVSRLEALSQISPVVMGLLIAIGSIAATVFVTRHTVMLHRFIKRGEQFVTSHWKLDTGLVAVVVVVVLLTRTAGFIQ